MTKDTKGSFGRMVAQMEREAAAQTDVVLNTARHVELVEDGAGVGALFHDEVPGIGGRVLKVTDFAHGQIAGRAKIPQTYYQRMLEHQPDLLIDNVRTWWQAEPENRLVRALGDVDDRGARMRAWLSDRYRVLDNRAFLETVLAEAEKHGAEVVSADLGDERLYIKMVTPKLSREIKPGDTVQAGIIAQNSEVGDGRVLVQPFALRLVCTNGLIVPTRFARVHLGSKLDLGVLAQDTMEAENHSILLQVRDWVRATFSGEHLDDMVARFRHADKVVVSAKPHLAVANVVRRYGLRPSEAQGVLERYLRANQDTQFGLVNAVTQYAHEGGVDYRRQVELESLGGELLTNDTAQFDRLMSTRLSEEEIARSLFGKAAAN